VIFEDELSCIFASLAIVLALALRPTFNCGPEFVELELTFGPMILLETVGVEK
jgi:hypothetical protein